MSIFRSLLIAVPLVFSAVAASAEMIRVESAHPARLAMDRLEALVKTKGFTVFARIDHAAGAQSVAQTLRPTEVLIFGNPAGGTPLIQAEQTMGLSLPLHVLVWQDAAGKTYLGYDSPASIAAGRSLKDHPAIPRIGEALKAMTEAAAQ